VSVAERILPLLSGVRSRSDNRWLAFCPAHEDKNPSLSLLQTHDRLLMYCWAGCRVVDICAAIGIGLLELFHNRHARPDPCVLRRRRAADALESWRQTEIGHVADDLRLRDMIIRKIDTALHDRALTEDEAWISLAYVYDGYTDLEYRFSCLLDGKHTLQMWRELRRA